MTGSDRRFNLPRPISRQDGLSKFSSREPALDEWLRKFALTNSAGGTNICSTTGDRVVGYYSLVMASAQRAELPSRIAKGQIETVGVVLLGRLQWTAPNRGAGWAVTYCEMHQSNGQSSR